MCIVIKAGRYLFLLSGYLFIIVVRYSDNCSKNSWLVCTTIYSITSPFCCNQLFIQATLVFLQHSTNQKTDNFDFTCCTCTNIKYLPRIQRKRSDPALIHSSIYSFIYSFIQLSIHPSIHLHVSIHPSIHLSIHRSIYLSIY